MKDILNGAKNVPILFLFFFSFIAGLNVKFLPEFVISIIINQKNYYLGRLLRIKVFLEDNFIDVYVTDDVD